MVKVYEEDKSLPYHHIKYVYMNESSTEAEAEGCGLQLGKHISDEYGKRDLIHYRLDYREGKYEVFLFLLNDDINCEAIRSIPSNEIKVTGLRKIGELILKNKDHINDQYFMDYDGGTGNNLIYFIPYDNFRSFFSLRRDSFHCVHQLYQYLFVNYLRIIKCSKGLVYAKFKDIWICVGTYN